MTLPRVYPIVDTGALERRGGEPHAFARALLEGGAGILQFRHKGVWQSETLTTLERIAGECRQARVPLIVNDRVDVALLIEDAGVHVGQHDLPAAAARRLLGEGRVLGFSTHNAAQFAAAGHEPVDYVALGPVFGTASKENPDPVVGLEGVRAICAGSSKPVVAIGGITRATARAVLAAGADAIAVIGDLLPERLDGISIRRRMEEWLQQTQN